MIYRYASDSRARNTSISCSVHTFCTFSSSRKRVLDSKCTIPNRSMQRRCTVSFGLGHRMLTAIFLKIQNMQISWTILGCWGACAFTPYDSIDGILVHLGESIWIGTLIFFCNGGLLFCDASSYFYGSQEAIRTEAIKMVGIGIPFTKSINILILLSLLLYRRALCNVLWRPALDNVIFWLRLELLQITNTWDRNPSIFPCLLPNFRSCPTCRDHLTWLTSEFVSEQIVPEQLIQSALQGFPKWINPWIWIYF